MKIFVFFKNNETIFNPSIDRIVYNDDKLYYISIRAMHDSNSKQKT
jgi:hypothetical protein